MIKVDETNIVSQTKIWISQFVIKLQLCPFASIPYDNNQIHYKVTGHREDLKVLEDFWDICQIMLEKSNTEISNSFLIFSEDIEFEKLLDIQAICDSFLEEGNLDEYFQTVIFHPKFKFSGEGEDQAGNYVNRSPWPMLHILRSEEMTAVTRHITDPEAIPLKNKETLERLGTQQLKIQLKKYRS